MYVAPPASPSGCNTTALNSTAINVQWAIPTNSCETISSYTITYTAQQSLGCVDNGVSTRQPITTSIPSGSTKLVVANLQKATSYSFSLIANNSFGSSPPTTGGACTVYTQEDGKVNYIVIRCDSMLNFSQQCPKDLQSLLLPIQMNVPQLMFRGALQM